MTKDAILCPACGSAETIAVPGNRLIRVAADKEVEVADEFTRCVTCGEEFYTRAQSLAASRARAGALRAEEGLLTPDEIVAIRTSFCLTQEQFERALGVGAKTVVRWEKGTVRQSAAIDLVLRIARIFPDAFAWAAERNGVALSSVPGRAVKYSDAVWFSGLIEAPATSKAPKLTSKYKKVRVRGTRSRTRPVRQAA